MMTNWLSIEEAAKRVGRSVRTIYRWGEGENPELRITVNRVREDELLEVDRMMRKRLGRPRKESDR
jgi:transposase